MSDINPTSNPRIIDATGAVWEQAPLFAPGEIERAINEDMAQSAGWCKPVYTYPAKAAVGELELEPQWAMTVWQIARLPVFKDHTYKHRP